MLEWIPSIATIVGAVGLFGWSHRSLLLKIEKLDEENKSRLTEKAIRMLINDRMAPLNVEYANLSLRLTELKESHKELDKKVDQLLYLCSKLSDANQK